MTRFLLLLPLLGACLPRFDFDPPPPDMAGVPGQMPFVRGLLADDGVDPPHVAFSLCHGAPGGSFGFGGCAAAPATDQLVVCDAAKCQSLEFPVVAGSGGAQSQEANVTLGSGPVAVTWSNDVARAGFEMVLPDDFAPSADRASYTGSDSVTISWAASAQHLQTGYAIEQSCGGAVDAGVDLSTGTVQAFGAGDPGEVVLDAGPLGVPGRTCTDTVTIIRTASALPDSDVPAGRVDASTVRSRKVTFTVTE